MKIEIHSRLSIGNTTRLKFLGYFISNLSFATGYPPYIMQLRKVCEIENFVKEITSTDKTYSPLFKNLQSE